uniref:ABM domain-containing protein n=2 Tax=Arion vulgaris TaxID=1028688 RepID=A0A0B7AJP5_9EUPU
MNHQIDRLSHLIDRLERKINFDGFRDEEVVTEEDNTLLLVQREFEVKLEHLEEVHAQLRAYVETTQGFRGCLNVSVRELQISHSFNIYEIWTTEEKYVQNCGSEVARTLLQKTAELLEKPETVHSMKIPACWWKREF